MDASVRQIEIRIAELEVNICEINKKMADEIAARKRAEANANEGILRALALTCLMNRATDMAETL